MIDALLTIDYELYGDGTGSLRELVYEPMERLRELFAKARAPLVVFVEASELEVLEREGTDECSADIRRQLRACRTAGFEIALHLHPQWYNGRFVDGRWNLDDSEYNLCLLPEHRIEAIISRSITYLRDVLGDHTFVPFSFRAGNWLFQPTALAARTLARHGVRVDSSVFKGGLQRKRGLDYRRALRNGYFWPIDDDANVPSAAETLLEIPIHTEMAPLWRMATGRRMKLQTGRPGRRATLGDRVERIADLARFRYPQKLDFCRMTPLEAEAMIVRAHTADRASPTHYRPLVAIGHTKDLVDTTTTEKFFETFDRLGIRVVDFPHAFAGCRTELDA